MSIRRKIWLVFLGIIVLAGVCGYVANPKSPGIDIHQWGINYTKALKYHLGLDLQGGTQLIYQADLSSIVSENYANSMAGVRDVIERRVNLFGVAEPVVQVVGIDRLSVELAGIKDVAEAIKMIGETPILDFREEMTKDEIKEILKVQGKEEVTDEKVDELFGNLFKPTGLSGKQLTSARVNFDSTTYKPVVDLEFNAEGTQLFTDITTRNVGKRVAIYLDNTVISAPVVNEPIKEGHAVITGSFTNNEAQLLAQRLNAGALPVPIKLISQQTVGASLGKDSLTKSLFAGMIGFLVVIIFMVLYYRLPGVLATLALLVYAAIILALFKLIPVTLTLAGIAGFILSIGMAVDANVLIFERMREELRRGKSLGAAIDEGFKRAWPSIRDSNITTLITGLALFWFGTGMIKGFAITLSIGVLVSMFSAITVTQTFLKLVAVSWIEKHPGLFVAVKNNPVLKSEAK